MATTKPEHNYNGRLTQIQSRHMHLWLVARAKPVDMSCQKSRAGFLFTLFLTTSGRTWWISSRSITSAGISRLLILEHFRQHSAEISRHEIYTKQPCYVMFSATNSICSHSFSPVSNGTMSTTRTTSSLRWSLAWFEPSFGSSPIVDNTIRAQHLSRARL